MKGSKKFKLYVMRPSITLYNSDLQEVPFSDALKDGTLVYELIGRWNKKIENYVTGIYYAVERRESEIYIDKLACVGDVAVDINLFYRCKGGRIIRKTVLLIRDKKFIEMCQLPWK